MKRFLIIPLLALALGACTAQLQSVGNFVSSATSTVTNPLGPVDIYRVKNVYAAGLELAVQWRLYCWARPYSTLMADPIAKPVCQNRRPIARQIVVAKNNASRAIAVADKFIRENPSGNAVSYVTAAWSAVQSFRSTIPAVK